MGTIWVREFTGGLDTRRMPETTQGGALIRAVDLHITRGGELEKRAAFVPTYTLPSGTVGMAAGVSGVYVFGHTTTPSGLSPNVGYQQLVNPADATMPLARILSTELYSGKLYVVAEFQDGSRFHYYDGTRVQDWYDGRARVAMEVTGGAVNAATPAQASFDITGGSASTPLNRITYVRVDGVDITQGAVAHTGNNETTALAVANAINAFTSTPNYTAVSEGVKVIITAATPGSGSNGFTLDVGLSGNVTVGGITNMAGGVDASVSELSDLTVDGVPIINGAVQWSNTNEETANLIADAINTAVSVPDYRATYLGNTVNIIADDAGTASNGLVVAETVANGLTVNFPDGTALAGGKDPDPATAASGSFDITGGSAGAGNQVTDIKINGVSIINAPVPWATSHAQTATDVATAINGFTSTPNYTAAAVGATVTVTAAATGPAVNDDPIVVTVGGNVTVGNPVAMSGGANEEAMFTPGTFVKTVGSRMTAVADELTHGSGLSQPTKWTTDTTGAFFIDMSTRSAGAEELTSLALYQNYVAVFAERVIQIWSFDSDPNNSDIVQVLNNTGTGYPKSVTQFGDNDLFYADESGVRSLRARDSSNAAATTDIGVPIDTLVTKKLAAAIDNNEVIGIIEPRDGRFWLSVGDTIYVFSFFPGSKVSAWSTYTAKTLIDGTETAFNVDYMTTFNKKVYIRGGDTIYVYSGLGLDAVYDEVEGEAWLPFLDGGAPTIPKTFTGLDAALEGFWELSVAQDPVQLEASEVVTYETRTTYNDERRLVVGSSTHISPRLKTKGGGYARCGSIAITFNSSEDAPNAG